MSIKRDDVTGSTLSGNKVKAYIAHINKKDSVNSRLTLNLSSYRHINLPDLGRPLVESQFP